MRRARNSTSRRAVTVALALLTTIAFTIPAASAAETTDEGAHNLSAPLFFAEGIGLAGAKVEPGDITTTGLPGLTKSACSGAENWGTPDAVAYTITGSIYDLLLNDTMAASVTVPGAVGTLPADGDYFLQPPKSPLDGSFTNGEDTCWEADWIDGTTIDGRVTIDRVDWGDNLVSVQWGVGTPIRVEVALYQDAETPGTFQDGLTLTGFPMTALWPPPISDGKPAGVGGGQPLEVWATASAAGAGVRAPADFAMIYTRGAHLTIDRLGWSLTQSPSGVIPDPLNPAYETWVSQRISDETAWGSPGGEGSFGAEVNLSGKVVYGRQLNATAPGWYRVTFSIDQTFEDMPAGAEILGLDDSDLAGEVAVPRYVSDPLGGGYTYLDIYVGTSPSHGKMTGRVSDTSGHPLAGIEVIAHDLDGTAAALMSTDVSGVFEGDLTNAGYKLEVIDPSGSYLSEWFDDAYSLATADVVTVPQVVPVDIQLELIQPGVIQGLVTSEPFGLPIAGAVVTAYRDGAVAGSSVTMPDGSYHLLLPDDHYTLLFAADGYVSEWYENAADQTAATDLVVGNGAKVVIDAALARTELPLNGTGFSDVDITDVFAADIAWLHDTGITLGCNPPENTMFCPDDLVRRGQMASFLTRAKDLAVPDGDHFADDDGNIHEAAINSLFEAGITKGCNPPDNTMFCPNDFVTRAQMATFLTRAFQLPEAGGDHFADDDGNIHEAAINSLFEAGITKGCNPPDNTMFCPNDFVTRAQMAAFLHRAATE